MNGNADNRSREAVTWRKPRTVAVVEYRERMRRFPRLVLVTAVTGAVVLGGAIFFLRERVPQEFSWGGLVATAAVAVALLLLWLWLAPLRGTWYAVMDRGAFNGYGIFRWSRLRAYAVEPNRLVEGYLDLVLYRRLGRPLRLVLPHGPLMNDILHAVSQRLPRRNGRA